MNKEDLIRKYESGECSPEEVRQIEKMILDGALDPLEFSHVREMTEDLEDLDFPGPGLKLEEGFYAKLASEKAKNRKRTAMPQISFGFLRTGWGLALYTTAILVVGFLFVYNSRQDNQELVAELRDMKEVMLLTMLEKESTSDRLKAVNMSTSMDQASAKVISALLQTLNQDPNTNVRLAALEALIQYSELPEVRKGLVEAIVNQDSPLVLISMAEVMEGLQEKESVEALKEILDREQTPDEVKEKVNQTIESLI